MDLTDKDVDRILKIIDESGYEEVKLEVGAFKLHVRKKAALESATDVPRIDPPPAPPPRIATSSGAAGAPIESAPASSTKSEVPEGLVAVRAPMLGTFYRAASPGAKPFVEVGGAVKANDTICLIEVMKLYNSVKAGVDGIVVKIVAENGAMVEHGQVLMLIEHSLVDAAAETE
jgi:acetyl-CoA carboxylase biotin carboxyl carrier protein